MPDYVNIDQELAMSRMDNVSPEGLGALIERQMASVKPLSAEEHREFDARQRQI